MHSRKGRPAQRRVQGKQVGKALATAVAQRGFGQAAVKSFLMILVTEVGDETFIIAAIMAMRHPRRVVYLGAMTALISMTVLLSLAGGRAWQALLAQ